MWNTTCFSFKDPHSQRAANFSNYNPLWKYIFPFVLNLPQNIQSVQESTPLTSHIFLDLFHATLIPCQKVHNNYIHVWSYLKFHYLLVLGNHLILESVLNAYNLLWDENICYTPYFPSTIILCYSSVTFYYTVSNFCRISCLLKIESKIHWIQLEYTLYYC